MKKYQPILAAVLTAVAVCCALACFRQQTQKAPRPGNKRQNEEIKMMEPKVFLEVPLNTFERTNCSPPEPDPSWRGVVIQAPRRVSFKRGVRVGETKAFAAIPICGLYVLDVPFPVVEDVVQLVAQDKKTGKIYSGPIVELDPSPEAPHPGRPPLRKEDVEGLATGRYFNPNLADFVKLPEAPAVYEVYAEVRGIRSNLVTIEIVEGELK